MLPDEPSPVPPTWDDPVVATLSEVAGGPMGTRSAGHAWWTPVRVLLVLTALTFAVGMWQKGNCYQSGWSDGQKNYTHMCYSDLPPLYAGRGFDKQHFPYTEDRLFRVGVPAMEYPVVISYYAWGSSVVSHWFDPRSQTQGAMKAFVIVNVIGLGVAALVVTWFLAGTNRHRPWDAAGFALAPALALTGIINWDLLALVFTAGALWAYARGRPLLTGILIGIGTATKLYPLFLLGGMLVIALRRRDLWSWVVSVLGAVAAFAVVNVPALLGSVTDWKVFWTFNQGRGADLGSIWLLVQQWRNHGAIPVHVINDVSGAFFAAWCLAVLVLGLRARATPRLAQLGFLIVLGFLLVNKVYSPQYVLWLLPLAALARPRWRDLLIWQTCEIIYFAGVWWYLDNDLAPAGGGDPPAYWIAILIRLAGQLYLGAMVVRDIWFEEADPVDRDEFEYDAEPIESEGEREPLPA